MDVKIATNDRDILACFDVMKELRKHIVKEEFCTKIRQQQNAGYRLAYISEDDQVQAVAGFREGISLAWGQYLYVDDLVTSMQERSKGYGKTLLDFMKNYAHEKGFEQVHLDSGIQRQSAHKFYQREGMFAASLHFVCLAD